MLRYKSEIVVTYLLILFTPSQCVLVKKCPDEKEILPCICIRDQTSLYLECNDVKDDAELANVFKYNFPSKQFEQLIIVQDRTIDSLSSLKNGIFGDVRFKSMKIEGTSLNNVEGMAFYESKEVIQSISLKNNKLSNTDFFSFLSSLKKLTDLDISGNQIYRFQPLVTGTLRNLILNDNPASQFLGDLTTQSKGLKVFEATDCDFQGSVAGSSFIGAPHIEEVVLDRNSYNILKENMFHFSEKTLKKLSFRSNGISMIEKGFLSGSFSPELSIDLKNNSMKYFKESVWKPILDQLTNDESVDFSENDLLCGCDILWLLSDQNYLKKVTNTTSCFDGTLLTDLDPSVYDYLCSM